MSVAAPRTDAFPPPGATDCHAHVVGPKARYPLVSPRAYTPVDAPVEALIAMLDRLGLARVVLIQTSVFGTDNSCLMDALDRLGDRGRGVVQLAPEVDGAAIDALHQRGARGIRVNLNTTGLNDPDWAREGLVTAAAMCARNGWHIQLFTTPAVIESLANTLMALPVPVVLDHFGLVSPVGETPLAEAVVLRLLESGKGWVKISGTYRLPSNERPDAMAALARRLAAANVEHLLWGSDWPHTPPHEAHAEPEPPEAPYRDLDTNALLETIRDWFHDDPVLRAILVGNPARLYGWSG